MRIDVEKTWYNELKYGKRKGDSHCSSQEEKGALQRIDRVLELS